MAKKNAEKFGSADKNAYFCKQKVTMTFNQLDFATYCIGSLSERLGMNQLAVYEKLKHSNILSGYIIPAYDVLHTFSGQYITDELIDCLKEKGELQ